jgi:hypothetical protein
VNGAVRFVAVVVVGAAVALLGVYLAAWWSPFVVAFVAGALLARARWAIPAGVIIGLTAWGVPLLAVWLNYGIEATSLALAAIMGFNGAATVPIGLTVIVGLLLGLCGAWLGSAMRSLLPTRLRPVHELRDQRLEVKDSVLTKR